MPAADFGVLVLALDDFALLGEADLAGDGAGRLGKDGVEAGTAAAADGAAAAVKEAQADVAAGEDIDQRAFGLVERPVGGQEAAVLVAVGVAQHDFLRAVLRALHALADFGQVEPGGHDVGAALQVGDGFKERHDHEAVFGKDVLSGGRDEAGLFLQDHDFEQVAERFGVRDDGLAHGLFAVARAAGGGGAQDGELAGGVFGVGDPGRRERARLGEFGAQEFDAFVFGQGQVVEGLAVVRDAGAREEFGKRAFVDVGALAQVDGGQVKAEDFEGLLQAGEAQLGEGGAVVRGEGCGDDGEVGGEFLGGVVGGSGDSAAAGKVLAGQAQRGGGQPGVDADEGAPVGFVAAVRGVVAAALGEREQFGVCGDEQGGDGQFSAQRVDFLQVVFEEDGGLAQQGAFERGGVDVGIAVAVAADPAAHAQEGFERRGRGGEGFGGLAVEQFGEVAVQARDDLQKGAAVVRERVFDFVGDGQARVAQHAGLPQGGDAAEQGGVEFGQFVGRELGVALRKRAGDFAVDVERAFALHFGGMRGEDGHDAGFGQQAADARHADALAAKHLDGFAQAATRGRAVGEGAGALAAVLVAVFGDVGQVQEVAEGACDGVGVAALQALDALLKQFAVGVVAFAAEFDGGAAQGFDGVEDALAFAFFDDFS